MDPDWRRRNQPFPAHAAIEIGITGLEEKEQQKEERASFWWYPQQYRTRRSKLFFFFFFWFDSFGYLHGLYKMDGCHLRAENRAADSQMQDFW